LITLLEKFIFSQRFFAFMITLRVALTATLLSCTSLAAQPFEPKALAPETAKPYGFCELQEPNFIAKTAPLGSLIIAAATWATASAFMHTTEVSYPQAMATKNSYLCALAGLVFGVTLESYFYLKSHNKVANVLIKITKEFATLFNAKERPSTEKYERLCNVMYEFINHPSVSFEHAYQIFEPLSLLYTINPESRSKPQIFPHGFFIFKDKGIASSIHNTSYRYDTLPSPYEFDQVASESHANRLAKVVMLFYIRTASSLVKNGWESVAQATWEQLHDRIKRLLQKEYLINHNLAEQITILRNHLEGNIIPYTSHV
jgi:hypothetical protein